MRKLTFLAGVGAGYVSALAQGATAYDQIVSAFNGVRENPTVAHTADKVAHQAVDLAGTAKDKVTSTIDEHRHPEQAPVVGSTGTMNGRTNGTIGL